MQVSSRRGAPLRVLCSMIDPHRARAGGEVHGAADQRALVGHAHVPVGEVAVGRHLEGAEDRSRRYGRRGSWRTTRTESTMDAPGRSVMRRLPASTRSGSARSDDASGPTPMTPFSDWMKTSRLRGADSRRRARGMPMPRLTSMPSSMSWAARHAICRRLSGFIVRAHSGDRRRGRRRCRDSLHALVRRSARPPTARTSATGEARGRRHRGPEIHLRVAKGEIAVAVGGIGAHQREVARDRLLQHVVAALEACAPPCPWSDRCRSRPACRRRECRRRRRGSLRRRCPAAGTRARSCRPSTAARTRESSLSRPRAACTRPCAPGRPRSARGCSE